MNIDCLKAILNDPMVRLDFSVVSKEFHLRTDAGMNELYSLLVLALTEMNECSLRLE